MEIHRLVWWLVGTLAATALSGMLLPGLFAHEPPSLHDHQQEDHHNAVKWKKKLEESKEFPVSSEDNRPHTRRKRLLWITTDGRLALPPGTRLTITPSLSLPFVRYPPEGFLSNMTISLPFSIDFDMLGLTDNQNPYGVLPPLLGRSLGRQAGSYFADYVAQFLERKRHSRSAPPVYSPKVPLFHGGERALLYAVVEDLLTSFGMDGKACLLRAICEVNSHGQTAIQKYGLVGEIMQLFFTATKSPFANLMNEYVEAENVGREKKECWPYFKDCSKSLFRASHNKYSSGEENNEIEEELTDEPDEDVEIKVEDEDEIKSNQMM